MNATNSTTLRVSLHEVIDDHTRFPYTSSNTDTWDILELADEDPNDADHILDVYKNASYHKIGGGNGPYNREHTWPKSCGFPDNTSENYPYTDCHMLFLCDGGYNSSRSNNPYRKCNAGCTERTALENNGQGGGSGEYPGNSNWRTGSGASGTSETCIGCRGDVARALSYMDVRYEGGTHGPPALRSLHARTHRSDQRSLKDRWSPGTGHDLINRAFSRQPTAERGLRERPRRQEPPALGPWPGSHAWPNGSRVCVRLGP